MRKQYPLLTFIFIFLSLANVCAQNNVGIGTPTPDASAILELRDNSRGVLVPRLTSAQRTSIAAPANGLLVFDTDQNCFFFFVFCRW